MHYKETLTLSARRSISKWHVVESFLSGGIFSKSRPNYSIAQQKSSDDFATTEINLFYFIMLKNLRIKKKIIEKIKEEFSR